MHIHAFKLQHTFVAKGVSSLAMVIIGASQEQQSYFSYVLALPFLNNPTSMSL